MSKKPFKSQASSSRTFSSGPSSFSGLSGFSQNSTRSVLSYIIEPPDLSSISEPNVVVAFKNLSKKDSTTKAKALEDLRSYVLEHSAEQGGVEDAILEAWVGLSMYFVQASSNGVLK